MTTGERIKAARKKANMTQAALGKELGVSASMVAQYENGARKPKYETLQTIAEALDVTVGYFLGHDSIDAKQFLDALRKRDIRAVEQMSGLPEGVLLPMLTPEDVADLERSTIEVFQKSAHSWEGEEEFASEVRVRHDSDLEKLLDYFYRLNEEGRCAALDRVQELTEIPKYQRETNE